MAHWHYTLDIKAEWKASSEDEGNMTTLAKLCTAISTKLAALPEFKHPSVRQRHLNDRRLELVRDFQELAEDPVLDYDIFNSAMTDLYDWGDSTFNASKTCWIATF